MSRRENDRVPRSQMELAESRGEYHKRERWQFRDDDPDIEAQTDALIDTMIRAAEWDRIVGER